MTEVLHMQQDVQVDSRALCKPSLTAGDCLPCTNQSFNTTLEHTRRLVVCFTVWPAGRAGHVWPRDGSNTS